MTVLRQLSMKVKAEGYPFVVTILFLATALSMLLAASISVPLSQTTRILRLKADVDGVTRFVNFGIWGYCLDFVGSESFNTTLPHCSRRTVGWIVGSDIIDFLQISKDGPAPLTRVETSMLVMYPTSAVLIFFNLIASLAVYTAGKLKAKASIQPVQSPRYLGTLYFLSCLIVLTTFFALLVHVELVTSVKKAIHPSTGGNPTLRLEWGNTTWLSVSTLLSLLGNVVIIRSIRTAKRRRNPQIRQIQSPTIPSTEKLSTTVVGEDHGPWAHI